MLSSLRRAARRGYQTPAAHRAMPWGAASRLIARRAAQQWESDEQIRDDARRHMRYLVGLSDRASEVDDLAQRYLRMKLQHNELRWRPWLITRQRIANVETLRAAYDSGGLILSFVHHGQFDGIFGSCAHEGIRLRIAGGPILFGDDTPPHLKRHADNCRIGGGDLFPVAEHGFRGMVEMLKAGDTVALAPDLPGGTEMTVLGRRVRAAAGTARLSVEARVPILPIYAREVGDFQELEVGEPIDTAGITDFRQVQEEIGRRHEAAILAWPEAIETPLARWRPVAADDLTEFDYDDDRLSTLRA